MGSSTVLPLYPPAHTQLPKAALLMFVLILLPELGWGFGGGEWGTLRCMVMVKTD